MDKCTVTRKHILSLYILFFYFKKKWVTGCSFDISIHKECRCWGGGSEVMWHELRSKWMCADKVMQPVQDIRQFGWLNSNSSFRKVSVLLFTSNSPAPQRFHCITFLQKSEYDLPSARSRSDYAYDPQADHIWASNFSLLLFHFAVVIRQSKL